MSNRYEYLRDDLSNCKLCAWECGVDRLAGERGVCGIGVPEVASSMLHPAPPASYDAFMVGCCFRCIFCQNWEIANYPENEALGTPEGYYEPAGWAEMGVAALKSLSGKLIGADRLFFTGGEPTCSLTWVEAVVREARKIDSSLKVNYDTNGFLTTNSLKRVLAFTTSITFDIKAYNDDTFLALTGAPVEPVLRNVEYVARRAKNKLWEFRIMVIPGVHETEVPALCEFLAELDPTLPVSFLAFRPNFVMDAYLGATYKLMEYCVGTAKQKGLEDVSWSGHAGIKGSLPGGVKAHMDKLRGSPGYRLAMAFAIERGCIAGRGVCKKGGEEHERTHPLRRCGECVMAKKQRCKLRRFVPARSC
jgi:pyruvate formate lyase activating enzyme